MYIKGFHSTKFENTSSSSYQLAYETALGSLKQAEMRISELDAVMISNINLLTSSETTRHISSIMSSLLKVNIPIIHIPAACAGGGVAVHTANRLGYDNILVIGTEKMSSANGMEITESILKGAEPEHEYKQGLNFPAQNALLAQQHILKYGSTVEDFNLVAKKNHDNGMHNSNSKFYGKEISMDKIRESAMVASPLQLFHCTFPVDGAASVILSNDKTELKLAGSGMAMDEVALFQRDSLTNFKASRIAVKLALDQAGFEIGDINFAEIHDAFGILEIISYEDLGFCKEGEGKNLIRDGATKVDGSIPVNASGGLKAKGHPLSATGIGQIVEICTQLRGEGEGNQISSNKCKIGLAQNIGGAGGTVTVNIIEKV